MIKEGANMSNILICGAGGIFVVQMILLVVQLVVAHRVRVVKRQLENITEQVQQYLRVVLDAEGPEESNTKNAQKTFDEEESRLISAVLQEIFP
jgi:predicted negative regulator of RcsB-dependent stress response